MILITGAAGFVGKNLVEKMSKDSKIRCLTFRKKIPSSKNVEVFSGSLLNEKLLERAAKDVSVVVHLAAVIESDDWNDFERVNVKGTQNLVDACIKVNVKKFIFMSSHDVTLKNKSEYSRSKIEGEKIVKDSGIDYIIIRPTVIYGRGGGGLDKLTNIIRKYPFVPVPGNGKHLLQPIHVNDVADFIIKSIDSRKKNKIYSIGGKDRLTLNQVINMTSNAMSKKTIKIHVPLFVFKMLLKPWNYRKLMAITENKICNMALAERDMGFKPMGFNQGLKMIL